MKSKIHLSQHLSVKSLQFMYKYVLFSRQQDFTSHTYLFGIDGTTTASPRTEKERKTTNDQQQSNWRRGKNRRKGEPVSKMKTLNIPEMYNRDTVFLVLFLCCSPFACHPHLNVLTSLILLNRRNNKRKEIMKETSCQRHSLYTVQGSLSFNGITL